MKPPYAIGSVPSLSGHAVAYRWRSLPRVRRHDKWNSSTTQGIFCVPNASLCTSSPYMPLLPTRTDLIGQRSSESGWDRAEAVSVAGWGAAKERGSNPCDQSITGGSSPPSDAQAKGLPLTSGVVQYSIISSTILMLYILCYYIIGVTWVVRIWHHNLTCQR